MKVYRKDETDVVFSQWEDDLAQLDTLDAIIIPKGATNGDMLKAMFPQLKTIGFMTTTKKKIVVALYPEDSFHDFDLDWWNAPYRR